MISANLSSLILIISVTSVLIKTVYSFIAANIYELKRINAGYDRQKHPYKAIYRRRPLITILVSALNDEDVIGDCLKSLVASSYKKVEVIVIDHHSKDCTREVIKSFNAKKIRLIARRSEINKDAALKKAAKRYAGGELILSLSPNQKLDKKALSNLVNRYNENPQVDGLALRQSIVNDYSLSALLQKFINFSDNRSSKLFSLVKINAYKSALLLKRDIYLKDLYSKIKLSDACIIYVNDALVYDPPASNTASLVFTQSKINFLSIKYALKQIKNWPYAASSAISSVFLPLFMSYLIYLAAILKEPTPLMVSLLIISAVSVLSIWQDSRLKLGKKVVYSLSVPLTYIFIYAVSIFSMLLTIKSLLWPKFMTASSSS